jgi:murein DD-endopeptidase MepM/ murein hydrolase activator NlpD
MLRSRLLLVPFAFGLLLPVAVPTVWAAPSAPPVSPALVAAPIDAVGESATATATAVRLQKVAPPNFPVAPTPRCYVLDNFGDPRSGGRIHQGTDILASLGQEVYAMADGTLTFQAKVGDGRSGTTLSGNLWKLTAANGTYYTYAHLSAFAPNLAVGSYVYKGQLIGYVGDTGNPGPGNYHLHFEIHPGGGNAVDPLPLLTVPAGCTVY